MNAKIKNDRKPRKSKVKSENPLPMETNVRGFAYAKFTDNNGQECSLQKSSAFGEEGGELIWLGVNNRDGKFNVLGRSDEARAATGGWGWQEKSLKSMFPVDCDINIPDRMHLTQADVKKLLPALKHFAKTGELPS